MFGFSSWRVRRTEEIRCILEQQEHSKNIAIMETRMAVMKITLAEFDKNHSETQTKAEPETKPRVESALLPKLLS